MKSSRFDPGSTSKTLNLSLLWFNEWSGSENLAYRVSYHFHKFKEKDKYQVHHVNK